MRSTNDVLLRTYPTGHQVAALITFSSEVRDGEVHLSITGPGFTISVLAPVAEARRVAENTLAVCDDVERRAVAHATR